MPFYVRHNRIVIKIITDIIIIRENNMSRDTSSVHIPYTQLWRRYCVGYKLVVIYSRCSRRQKKTDIFLLTLVYKHGWKYI